MAQVELTVIEQSGVEVTVLDAPGAQVAIGPSLSTATPEPVGLTGAAGTSTDAAKSDHVHAHGDQTGTSLHALATTSGAGFLSAAQFDLLDGATDQDSADTLVKRDASGDFAANQITADLVGNAATATKLATARTINGESFDGTANITLTAAPNAGSVVDASVASNADIALTKLATGALPTAITVASANIVDGTIVDADINASAAIALTKLATVSAGRVVMGNSSDVATATEITGDATLADTGVLTLTVSGVTPDTVNDSATEVTPLTIDAKGRITSTGTPVTITPSFNSLTDVPTTVAGYGITDSLDTNDARLTDERVPTDDSVTDAKVASNAAISLSKLATGALPTAITVESANIVDGTIVNADISASAAIALAKLETGALPTSITVASANIVDGTIVDADINGSAAIALSKLATGALPTAITVESANIVDGTIVNADISASAAIAGTKVAPDFGAQNVLTTGSIAGATLSISGQSVRTTALQETALPIALDAATMPGASVLGTDGQVYASMKTGANYEWRRVFAAAAADQTLVVGSLEAVSVLGTNSRFQSVGNAHSLVRYSASEFGCALILAKSRGDAGSQNNVILQSGDRIGIIDFGGADGVEFLRSARISAVVDDTPGVGSMPGRLEFSTNSPSLGINAPFERMRITNNGNVIIGATTSDHRFRVNGTIQCDATLRVGTALTKNTVPTNSNTSTTATAASLLTGIRTGTPTANIDLQVPTGTDLDAAFVSLANNQAMEWTVINLASATHAITVTANTDHTVVGNMVVAANSSARFASRKTAANTFITYRIGS